MTTTIDTIEIDWEKCWAAATQLGAITRQLIVDREYDTAREWALRMASAHGQASPANGQRALSYYELAILLGHEIDDVDGRAQLEWEALLGEVAKLKAAVDKKAEEAMARAEAEKRAAEERAYRAKAEREKAEREAETASPDEGEEVDDGERDDS
jgi:hypothetical protein